MAIETRADGADGCAHPLSHPSSSALQRIRCTVSSSCPDTGDPTPTVTGCSIAYAISTVCSPSNTRGRAVETSIWAPTREAV